MGRERQGSEPGTELGRAPSAGWSASTVADFYDEELELWRAVLGPSMHYHFGVVDPSADPEDAEAHFDHGVRILYPWIPRGARVLDVGCGWGGAGRLLRREREALLHGVTVSPAQARLYEESIPEARSTCVDAAHLELEGSFDVALMMESFCHVERPEEALRRIRGLAPRLLIVDHVSSSEGYEDRRWRMRFPSHATFRRLVEEAGFRIEEDEPTQVPWVPAARYWLRNLRRVFPDGAPEGQLRRLEGLCRGLIEHGGSPTQIRLLVASREGG